VVKLLFNIPAYVNDALKALGVNENAVAFNTDFWRVSNCCAGNSVMFSTSGSATIDTDIKAGPFTFVGIPLPPRVKKYVALDWLGVSVTGTANSSILGNYDGCQETTNWGGSGNLSAGIDVGGEAKAKTPKETIVLQGTLKGETGVTQSITIESTDMVITGNWDGLIVAGEIKLIYRTINLIKEEVSWPVLQKRQIPPITLGLPDFD